LQCVAVCCSVLQCRCSVHENLRREQQVCCSVRECVAVFCSVRENLWRG